MVADNRSLSLKAATSALGHIIFIGHVLGPDHAHVHGRTRCFILPLLGMHLHLQLREALWAAACTMWPSDEAWWRRWWMRMGTTGEGRVQDRDGADERG